MCVCVCVCVCVGGGGGWREVGTERIFESVSFFGQLLLRTNEMVSFEFVIGRGGGRD